MLKVAVTSCLHMDSTYIGHFDPELGIHTNWNEALTQLRKIVRYCNKNAVDYLILNGDVFHTGRPTPEAVLRLRMELDKLDTTRVIMEPGNHDLAGINAQHADPLTAYYSQSRWCKRVVVEPTVLDLDGFALALMPWFRVSGRNEIDQVGIEMADQVKRMSEIVEKHDGPSLFAGHLTTLTAANSFNKRGSELVATRVGLEAVLDEQHLDNGAWDKYALGHIHTRQKVGTQGKGVYTGSTHRVTFTEEHEKKGFYLYEWHDDGVIKTKFCNLGGRKLATVDLSDLTADQIIDESKYETMQTGDYFRLILPHEYALDEMAQSVQDVVFDLEDAGIYVETPNAPAPKSEKRTTSIPVKEEASPNEIMDAYLNDMEDVSPAQKKRVLEMFSTSQEEIAE